MVQASDLKRGMVMQIDGAPCRLIDVTLQSPSARGANLMVKVRYRNLLTDQVLDKTLRGGDKVDEADFERRKGQYLYAAGDNGVFMDLESYEQFEVGPELFDGLKGFLLDGTEVQLGMYEGRVVSIDPPMVDELTVVDTPPTIKGATAQAQLKEATLETGLKLMVPPYLAPGERIRVDTRAETSEKSPTTAPSLMQRIHHLAVDVELELVDGRVAHAHRRGPLVARQPVQHHLGEPPLAGQAVHDLQLGGRPGDRPEQPVAPRAGLVAEAAEVERVERERRVAQPRVAVVPVPDPADALRQRRGRGGDHPTGGPVGERLQRDQGADHGLAPGPMVARPGRPGKRDSAHGPRHHDTHR